MQANPAVETPLPNADDHPYLPLLMYSIKLLCCFHGKQNACECVGILSTPDRLATSRTSSWTTAGAAALEITGFLKSERIRQCCDGQDCLSPRAYTPHLDTVVWSRDVTRYQWDLETTLQPPASATRTGHYTLQEPTGTRDYGPTAGPIS